MTSIDARYAPGESTAVVGPVAYGFLDGSQDTYAVAAIVRIVTESPSAAVVMEQFTAPPDSLLPSFAIAIEKPDGGLTLLVAGSASVTTSDTGGTVRTFDSQERRPWREVDPGPVYGLTFSIPTSTARGSEQEISSGASPAGYLTIARNHSITAQPAPSPPAPTTQPTVVSDTWSATSSATPRPPDQPAEFDFGHLLSTTQYKGVEAAAVRADPATTTDEQRPSPQPTPAFDQQPVAPVASAPGSDLTNGETKVYSPDDPPGDKSSGAQALTPSASPPPQVDALGPSNPQPLVNPTPKRLVAPTATMPPKATGNVISAVPGMGSPQPPPAEPPSTPSPPPAAAVTEQAPSPATPHIPAAPPTPATPPIPATPPTPLAAPPPTQPSVPPASGHSLLQPLAPIETNPPRITGSLIGTVPGLGDAPRPQSAPSPVPTSGYPFNPPPSTAHHLPTGPPADGDLDDSPTVAVGSLRGSSTVRPGTPQVQAVCCPAAHPNPPLADICSICGTQILDRTVTLVSRPSLGRIRFGTGEIEELDQPLLLGRKPAHDTTHPNPEPIRLVRIDDPDKVLSRTHAEIRLVDWQVQIVDRDSMNHTWVTVPQQAPMQLRPGEAVPIPPGTTVNLGDGATFTYESSNSR